MVKLLNAMDENKRVDMLARKNFGGLTPMNLAKSYDFRHLIEWSEAQQGFYYLPTPPCVLVMYTTENRDGAEQERDDLLKALPEFNLRVEIRTNPEASEIIGTITDVQSQHPDMSALIVIIMSHGGRGTVCSGSGVEVKIQDILQQMSSPALEGKPKVRKIKRFISLVKELHVSLLCLEHQQWNEQLPLKLS